MNTFNKANEIINQMAIPTGSLGLLTKQIKKIFCAWNKIKTELKPCHLIFAADNGIVVEGVVKQPQDITYLQAKNMFEKRAAISCFCQFNNIPYKVIDVGINNEKSVGYNYKTAMGTKNFLQEDAMTKEEFDFACNVGKKMVKLAKSENYNIISLGEMGIGNTTTSSAVLHALTGVAPDFLIGYGANKSYPEVIDIKRKVVSKAVALHRKEMKTVEDIIRCVGGFDIAALYGAMLECAKQKIPFVLDGFITAVAFACASSSNKDIYKYAIASHLSREPGMLYALKLGNIQEKDIAIHADLALGEGTGAVLFLSMLNTMMYTVWHIEKMSAIENNIVEEKIHA